MHYTTILEAESRSVLNVPVDAGHLPPDAGKNGWVEQMFSMAISSLKRSEFRKKAFAQITFINFNYDCSPSAPLGQIEGLHEGSRQAAAGEPAA
jgi:hypothetical protein